MTRILLVLLFALPVWAQIAVPPLKGRVTDLTGTLKPEQIASLEQMLQSFEARKGSQITVLMVPTTQPETIEQFSIRKSTFWVHDTQADRYGCFFRDVWVGEVSQLTPQLVEKCDG